MKLLQLPTYETETHEVNTVMGTVRVAGRHKTMQPAKIVVQDELVGDEQLEDTFRTLKYGPMPDLAASYFKSEKIDKIVFEKDNVILYGVMCSEMERSATFNGRVFTCHVDHMEYINK